MNKLSKMLILGAFLGTGVSFGDFGRWSSLDFRQWLGDDYTQAQADAIYDSLKEYYEYGDGNDVIKNATIAAFNKTMEGKINDRGHYGWGTSKTERVLWDEDSAHYNVLQEMKDRFRTRQ